REPIHIAEHGVVVKSEQVSADSATVSIAIKVENYGRVENPRVEFATEIFAIDAEGRAVGSALASFAPVGANVGKNDSTVESKTTLPAPKWWSPESPNQYVAVTTASCDGKVVDR